MKKILFFIFILLNITNTVFAASENNSNILNIYAWSGEIPDFTIQQFEKETGIKVNFETYDSNEVLYTKLKADKNPEYDIIEPSSYYVDRMRRQNMLEKLDRNLLPDFKNISSDFLYKSYDPESSYSIPYVWGLTGIFINRHLPEYKTTHDWNDLWQHAFRDKLLMLDDSREVFSMALKSLGYSANDDNPDHIRNAYEKLRALSPNIRLFKSEGVIGVLADGDIDVGMAWNGDVYKAQVENKNLDFVFPKSGFVIWVDNFAIPKNAPHLKNAYRFLNFMLRATVARDACLDNGYPSANMAARQLLPVSIRNNPIAYPNKTILSHGEFQTDINDDALALYEKYWEKLKMGE